MITLKDIGVKTANRAAALYHMARRASATSDGLGEAPKSWCPKKKICILSDPLIEKRPREVVNLI